MSLADFLPAPKNVSRSADIGISIVGVGGSGEVVASKSKKVAVVVVPARYGLRGIDFALPNGDYDGGSYPEIHRLQYPLNMGRANTTGRQDSIATVSVSADGSVDYSGIVTQRVRKDQTVFKSYDDLVPKDPSQDELAKPDQETEQEVADKTRMALEKITNGKIAAGRPRMKPIDNSLSHAPTFVRYAAAKSGEQRIIRMQEMPVDPIEPAKFKHMKAPAGPPSPPVPILHSPPRKLTQADMNVWKIPPCISNWKNIKGYTIAADKRLASDGRGLQEVQINDKFASLSETLYLAERNARTLLSQRQVLQTRIDQKKHEAKEAQYRDMAAEARDKRAGIDIRARAAETYEDAQAMERQIEAVDEREDVRNDMKREHRREMRMSHMGTNARKSKMERDANRDVSEQIALGKRSGGASGGDALFDQRLFNQSQGMSSGFGNDEAYNTYDSALFDKGAEQRIYRPSKSIDEDMNVQAMMDGSKGGTGRFQPDRGFSGADTTVEQRGQGRAAPVQFEKGSMDTLNDGAAINQSSVLPAQQSRPQEDHFGMDKFLSEAKRSTALSHIGGQGHMRAAAGSSANPDDYAKEHSGRVMFSKAKSPPRQQATSPRRHQSPPRRSDDHHRRPSPPRRQTSSPRRRESPRRQSPPRRDADRSPPRHRDDDHHHRSRHEERRRPRSESPEIDDDADEKARQERRRRRRE